MSMGLLWSSAVGVQASQQVRRYGDRKAAAIGTAIVKYRSSVTGGWRVWFQSSYWSIANGDGLQLQEGDRLEVVGYDNGNQLVVRTA
jgi:membrane protein implicated in regulation of membrane protease activity